MIHGTSRIVSIDDSRRAFRRIASRQTFVAILYSQARTSALPSKVSRARHARRNVSCTASSASSNEASIR